MNEAERHDWLVRQGAERFVDTFLSTFKVMAKGGRTPGVAVPTREEILSFYTQTNDDYWAILGVTQPQEAAGQLLQWQQAEGA